MLHQIRIEKVPNEFPPEKQFAWILGKFAVTAGLDQVPQTARDMICNRILDAAGVALHAINHRAVVAARGLYSEVRGCGHSRMLGMPGGVVYPAFAAGFVNAVAARDDDWHDCYLKKEYSHPADTIWALLAKAQEIGASGADLMLAIAVAYEVQCAFVESVCLHENKMDHGTWILLGQLCGLASLCKFTEQQAYDAICIGLHQGFSTRGGRRGNMSPHKAFHPGYMTHIALEATGLAAQGIRGPNPIFEGVDAPFAWMMKFRQGHELTKFITHLKAVGKNRSHPDYEDLNPLASADLVTIMERYVKRLGDDFYEVDIPYYRGGVIARIEETYTKEHPTEYQSQAIIDGGWEVHDKLQSMGGVQAISSVRFITSNHTHWVIGSGEGTPEKMAPAAGVPIPSRETLDHCATATAAIAIVHGRPQNGQWNIEDYGKAADPEVQNVWRNCTTEESSDWTRGYLFGEAFGGKFIVTLNNGSVLEHVQDVARAHPKHPSGGFKRPDYIKKFERTAGGITSQNDRGSFRDMVLGLEELSPAVLHTLCLPATSLT